ncbi:MAG: hypothetical protein ISR59_02875 [Anaerolineales bacterium]|uniref:Uncharacterized protein n=1 Tax=Candidatus Desulfolinea nitratireducens TaxID=2841698 RepID=A0A8J6TH92_9CHLR|nr:hypothetical protein [Candidatus Desulfolinea nitratireducens]MBL6960026.1 hypothetical protein [Anaerolineales bacterium]
MVNIIKDDPFKHANEFLEIQEILIKRISYVERQIRQNRKRIKELKAILGSPEICLIKSKVRETKINIEIFQSQIKSYQDILIIFRWVGDALAFSLIDRWSLKPLGLKKESPGFISGKKGAKRERKIFRAIQKRPDTLALLNDLSNCMRHGDITVFHNAIPSTAPPLIFEIKSQKRGNKRELRQAEKIQKILNYLDRDYTDTLYGLDTPFTRLATTTKGVFFVDEVNAVLQSGRVQGKCYREIEKGLYYFSISNPTIEKVRGLIEKIAKHCVGEFIVGQVNKYVYKDLVYFPPTLSIVDPETLYLFCTGELILGVVLDTGVVQKKIESMGFGVEFLHEKEEPYLFIEKPQPPHNPPAKIGIGKHLFNRIFAEFMSMDWLITETIETLNGKISEFRNLPPSKFEHIE